MKSKKFFWILLMLIWVLIFGSFVVSTLYLGGDALSGKIENNHYYLGYKGKFTEVSYNIFLYSKIHTITFITVHLAIFILAGVDWIKSRK